MRHRGDEIILQTLQLPFSFKPGKLGDQVSMLIKLGDMTSNILCDMGVIWRKLGSTVANENQCSNFLVTSDQRQTKKVAVLHPVLGEIPGNLLANNDFTRGKHILCYGFPPG